MVNATDDWTEIQAQAVRDQLDTLLNCDLFSRSDRQRRFLEYVVREELAGCGRKLNQYAIAMDVFDRDATFDPLIDSIVRVEARRLRSKLTEYYAEAGKQDTTVLKLPKGRYRIAVEPGNSHDQSTHHSEVIHPVTPRVSSIAVLPFDNLSGVNRVSNGKQR